MDEDVDNFELRTIGPLVENNPAFPNRINFEIVNIISKNAGTGFRLNDKNNSLLLLTDKEIFGRNKKRTYKSYSNNIPSNISSEPFKLGDNVVHIDHGVGKFIGTTQMGSSDKEFIVINYKNDDKLYVPSDQIDRIQVYKSFQKEDPTLDTLGSNKWIKTKNKPLAPKDVTPGSSRKVWWKCKKGHEWKAIIASRSKGSGCPYCYGKKVGEDNNLAVKFPEVAKEWHPTKNKLLTPKDVTYGSGKKVWWKCSKGHTWETTIVSRSKGNSCPLCRKQKRI